MPGHAWRSGGGIMSFYGWVPGRLCDQMYLQGQLRHTIAMVQGLVVADCRQVMMK